MHGTFSRMCAELSCSLTPALQAAGFTAPGDKFERSTVKYEFRRHSSSGTQVLSILFNKYRSPEFSAQLYAEPESGLESLEARGGTLIIGSVSSSRVGWPFSVKPFRAECNGFLRLFGLPRDRVKESVQAFLLLLPEIEEWWEGQQSTKHIVTSRLTYPGHSK